MATKALTIENFEDTINNNGIVMIDFWADWCGPCKMFAPTYEKVSEAHPDVVFGKIDTEDQQQLAAQFGIRSIPTIAVFRDQVLLFRQAGALPESAIEDVLRQVRDLDMDDVRKQIAEQQAKQNA
ncbi:MAG: thioredoxin [Rhodobacterales bacterium]|nr:thioredoxin [Rhodobacterales bacterium]